MNKILKKALIALGGIVAVLVALMAYVAATFNPNDYKPQIVQAVKDKFDRTLKIDGDIKLSFFPSLGADLGGLSLSEHGSEQEFAAVEKARVSLQLLPLLSRELVVSQVEVHGLRAKLVKNKNGSTNIDDLSGNKDASSKPDTKDQAEQKPIQFNIAHVLIDDASLGYKDEASGANYSLQKFMLKTGKIAPDTASDIEIGFAIGASQPKTNLAVQLKTRAAFTPASKHFKLDGLDLGIQGEAAGMSPLTLTLKGNIEGDAKAIQSNDLTIEFDAKQGEKTLKGKVSSPFAVALGPQTIDLQKLLLALTVTDPKSTRGPININLSGSARADLQKQRASLDFSTKFDDSTITGKAGLTHFSPPAYLFDLNIDKLDVDQYTASKKPAAAAASGPAGNQPAAGQPEQPIDLSPLKNLQATGSLKIASLKVANLKTQNLRVDLRANNGRLDLSPLTANLYQGTVNGSISVIAAATPQISVKQNLAGISIGPLLKDAIDRDILEGKGSINVDVTGQGATVAAIKKALNGTAAINLADGALKGINIAGTIRNAQAKLGALKGQSTHTANTTEKTDFTELKATFTIRNGIAHNADLSLKSPLLRLGGEGDINIGTDSMNYLAKATLVATTAGQGGKDASALSGLTVPVRISGPYTALNYSLDYNAMIGGVAQQKIDEKKEELKAKAEDKVKDKLKGLFGR